jgi:hypothetical protein
MESKTMAERKPQKARRLVVQFFNEQLQSLDLGTIDPEDLRTVLTTTATNGNWIMVLVMTKPLVMYWEVNYSKSGKFTIVKPYLPYTEFYYPDQPAPVKVKVAK